MASWKLRGVKQVRDEFPARLFGLHVRTVMAKAENCAVLWTLFVGGADATFPYG
jgi:hypothetical protein